MDVIAIERDITTWFAEQLELEPDKTLFRGGIPDGAESGVGVVFGSEIPTAGFYGFRPRTWNVQILGKFNGRDEALALLSRLSGLFPRSGFVTGGTRVVHIEPRGSGEPYAATDGGRVKTFATFNLIVSVLTTGAQTKLP